MKSTTGKNKFNLPWSDKGWYPDHVRRGRDPEIQRVIEGARCGSVNPLGFDDDRAFVAVSPATHNPYVAIVVSLGFIAIGFFIFVQMISAPFGASLVAGIFWLGGLFILTMNVIRIPSWHRARTAVRGYLKDHPGKLPKELRWYS